MGRQSPVHKAVDDTCIAGTAAATEEGLELLLVLDALEALGGGVIRASCCACMACNLRFFSAASWALESPFSGADLGLGADSDLTLKLKSFTIL